MSSLNPIGIPFIELLTVNSTNNYAMGMVRAGMAQHGTTVFAHEQTRGKGQRNRQWTSEKNQNIAMSVLIESKQLNYPEPFLLSMATAVSVYSLISRYVPQEIKIKWPNDIYCRDRKAAGILIENIWQGSEWKFAVIGIGININQEDFGELASKAVSLKQITRQNYEPLLLAREMCREINDQLRLMVNDPSLVISGYNEKLYKLNETVKLKKGNRVFESIVKAVTINGQLVVEHGVEEQYNVGEIEWIG